MAEKEQNVTLFNNPTLTLLEVKMKLRAAFRAVGKLFTSPAGHHSKSNPASPPDSSPFVPNKLKKKNQHYHLIRKVTGEKETVVADDHIQQWNDTISSKRMGKTRQVDSEMDTAYEYDPYKKEEEEEEEKVSWKLQIGELERWATELEIRMEEVNRHTKGVLEGTQEIMRGTIEMMKGTSKIKAGAIELLRRADELEEREMEMEKGLENMMKGAEEMIKGAEMMEKKADELKRTMTGPDSFQEGASTMMIGENHSPWLVSEYKSPASAPMGHRFSRLY